MHDGLVIEHGKCAFEIALGKRWRIDIGRANGVDEPDQFAAAERHAHAASDQRDVGVQANRRQVIETARQRQRQGDAQHRFGRSQRHPGSLAMAPIAS